MRSYSASRIMRMLIIFATLAGAFFIAERLRPWRAQRLFRTGFVSDVMYIPVHFLLRVLINGTVAVALATAGHGVLINLGLSATGEGMLVGRPLWMQCAVLLLVLDFLFYVTHRLKHRWTWWWRLHETHHSSRELDFLSATRFHPLEKILDRTIYLLPLVALGPSESAVLVWASVDAGMGMLIHSNANVRMGPLIYVLSGPEMHRWHHSRDPAIRNCNYGNNFSIFDWMFGTAYVSYERDGEFGIDDDRDFPHDSLIRQFGFAFRSKPRSASTPLPERKAA